jgi:hypothetical protein
MRNALAIFRKDARRLWPQVALFWLLLAMSNTGRLAWNGGAGPRTPDPRALALLACYYLVAALVLQESPSGDRQYWLTRPFSAWQLVAAKALFVAVFVNLATLLSQIALLLYLGIPPVAHLDALFWRQVFLCAQLLLPAAALCAAGRNYTQILLVALGTIVAFALAQYLIGRQILLGAWVAPVWLGPATRQAMLALAATGAILLRYTRRGALPCWIILGATAAIFFLMTLTDKETLTFRPVRVSLDTAVPSARPGAPRSGVAKIPLRIEGLPPGAETSTGPFRFSSIGPGGQDVGDAAGVYLSSIDAGKAVLTVPQRRVSAETPLHLSGSIEFVLIQRLQSAPVPEPYGIVRLPGAGVCSQRPNEYGTMSVFCLAPSTRTALALEFTDDSLRWVIPPDMAKLPGSFGTAFQPADRYQGYLGFEPGQPYIAKARAIVPVRTIAYMRGEFDFPAIRLADYQVHE